MADANQHAALFTTLHGPPTTNINPCQCTRQRAIAQSCHAAHGGSSGTAVLLAAALPALPALSSAQDSASRLPQADAHEVLVKQTLELPGGLAPHLGAAAMGGGGHTPRGVCGSTGCRAGTGAWDSECTHRCGSGHSYVWAPKQACMCILHIHPQPARAYMRARACGGQQQLVKPDTAQQASLPGG